MIKKCALLVYAKTSNFQVFNPVLQGLFGMMQSSSLVGKTYLQPVTALAELVELRNTDGARPICALIAQQVRITKILFYLSGKP